MWRHLSRHYCLIFAITCYKTVHTTNYWHRIPVTFCPCKVQGQNVPVPVRQSSTSWPLCSRLQGQSCPKICVAGPYNYQDTRGDMSLGTCPCFIFVCVYLKLFCSCYILPLRVDPATCLMWTMHNFVAATCPCDMSLHHGPSCAGNLRLDWDRFAAIW